VARELKGTRYLTKDNEELAQCILNDLPYLDFYGTLRFYDAIEPTLDDKGRALLNANDRFYLLTVTCKRQDAWHPWLFERCREVEANPDGRLDLWARYHYKSTICTFAGCLQEIIIDPEITIAIISGTNKVALPFLIQLQQEMERNDDLRRIHSDVFWEEPRKESPLWSREKGLQVKRRSNAKEATIEAFGLIDGMRTGKHYALLNYDDLVDETMINNPEIINKVTIAWELSDNLGQLIRHAQVAPGHALFVRRYLRHPDRAQGAEGTPLSGDRGWHAQGQAHPARRQAVGGNQECAAFHRERANAAQPGRGQRGDLRHHAVQALRRHPVDLERLPDG
jgi:hypothetical protein